MATSEDRLRFLPYLQLFLFIVIIVIAQYKLFTVAFALLIGFIFFVAIVAKQKRVFLWIIMAYLLGHIIFLYGDRIIDNLPYRANILMVLSRCLLLFPIIFMFYISKKFNEKANHYWKWPNWQAKISFPFIWSGFHSVSVKVFLPMVICINIVVFLPFILSSKYTLGSAFLVFVLLFSIVNGILEEILWRGILLTRMVDLAGEKAALLFSGIAFGFSHLVFGYSWLVCLGFAVGGFFYAGITIRSGSILPAIIWHIAFNILMIVSGIIPYVG